MLNLDFVVTYKPDSYGLLCGQFKAFTLNTLDFLHNFVKIFLQITHLIIRLKLKPNKNNTK